MGFASQAKHIYLMGFSYYAFKDHYEFALETKHIIQAQFDCDMFISMLEFNGLG